MWVSVWINCWLNFRWMQPLERVLSIFLFAFSSVDRKSKKLFEHETDLREKKIVRKFEFLSLKSFFKFQKYKFANKQTNRSKNLRSAHKLFLVFYCFFPDARDMKFNIFPWLYFSQTSRFLVIDKKTIVVSSEGDWSKQGEQELYVVSVASHLSVRPFVF